MKKIFTKKKPEKKLLISLKKIDGRSSSGRISICHRGGGARRLYRLVDFAQEKINMPAKVIALEYDPNRTAFIALLEYKDKEKRYCLAWQGLKMSDEIVCLDKSEIKPGNRTRLKNIPIGTQVFNIEIEPGKGGKLVRGAGTNAKVLGNEQGFCNLEMPSSEIRRIRQECFATIGQVSHSEKRFEKLKKAGQKRLMGQRPVVRGTAMNPCDHPHGGGEGRTPIGLKAPKTPWGKPALGVKTRRNKRTDKYIIKRRQKKR